MAGVVSRAEDDYFVLRSPFACIAGELGAVPPVGGVYFMCGRISVSHALRAKPAYNRGKNNPCAGGHVVPAGIVCFLFWNADIQSDGIKLRTRLWPAGVLLQIALI